MSLAKDVYSSILSVTKITKANQYSVAMLLVDLFCYQKNEESNGVFKYQYSDGSKIFINHNDESVQVTLF